MRILLHTCCGPCASACVPRLEKEGHSVALLFSNSNIDTFDEFERRRAAAEKLAAAENVEIAVGEYRHEEWLKEVAAGLENEPEKGERCRRCYRYNIAMAARYAAGHGFDAVTTSLTVSPHKPSALVFEAGRDAAGRMFAEFDFKKRGGFAESTRRARELGLYRQSYCGCEFSKREER
ncbi:MAG: epoxyqueuosine reductase QueH [Kiritimatiellae bacterium]|nr:epoxyqueuosine reductase QueH [Kiritimatiellia bacterium]